MRPGLICLVLLVAVSSITLAQEVGREGCCPSRAGRLGLGAWFHYEMICASLRHWPGETRALELNFCAPSRGERLQLFIKGLNNLSHGCFLNLYMTGGLGLPISGDIDWQRLEGSFGTEWCFPDIPQMAISLEVGASLLHYRDYWGDWHWKSQTFIGGGVHFYFPLG